MSKIYFIAGLPRSGSTLLAAILRQNPKISASISSPVGGILSTMQKSISKENEVSHFLTEEIKRKLLRNVFDSYYHTSSEIAFDTNRMWPSKLSLLCSIFEDVKMICMVRPIADIVDSFERIIQRNPLELSGIFNFDCNGNVFTRANSLTSPTGLIGSAFDILSEGFFGEHHKNLLLVEYETFARNPGLVLDAIHRFLKIESFSYDFDRIDQIPGAQELDQKLGMVGLHTVGSKVGYEERPPIIPLNLFNSYPQPFWKSVSDKSAVI